MNHSDGARKIKVMLIEANVTQAEIARLLGVSLQAVNNTIMRKRTSKRIIKGIALHLGKPPEEIEAIIMGGGNGEGGSVVGDVALISEHNVSSENT